jgi:DNA processing protein
MMIKVGRSEDGYPRRLRDFAHAPDPLWVAGRLPAEDRTAVAVVGTRRMTDYGRRLAREIASSLARAGVVIVSGLAQGIDSTAHSAALEAGGETVAVLGEGLMAFAHVGPLLRRRLAREIAEHGAVVSEYPLDVHGTEWTFPRRNETIVGLSDAVVVIEAPQRSGALITADFARAHGRPLFVAPGPVGATTWVGSNALIARGDATLLSSAEQVAERCGLTIERSAASPGPEATSNTAAGVLELLALGAADMDSIAQALGLSARDASTLVADMLITGSIVATGDGRFARR